MSNIGELFINEFKKAKRYVDLAGLKINRDIKLEDTIIVAGSPRGGTTWLMEILTGMPHYKHIFEPLHREWFPEIKHIDSSPRPYVSINEKFPELKKYLTKIFTGNIASLRPDYTLNPSSIHSRLFYDRIIVKFIRANRLLPWIAYNFKFRQIYFIIRHPCAIIASQIESGIRGYYLPKTCKIQKSMILKEVMRIPIIFNNKKLMRKIKSIKSNEEILAVVWSLDNYIPLAQPKPYPWQIVIYEKLLLNTVNETKKIYNILGENINKQTLKQLRKPSRTSFSKSSLEPPKQLSKYKNKLSKNQIENILKVTRWFGLDFYDQDPEPDYNSIYNWLPNETQ